MGGKVGGREGKENLEKSERETAEGWYTGHLWETGRKIKEGKQTKQRLQGGLGPGGAD